MFTTKCGMQGQYEAKKMCLRMMHTFISEGECKRLSLMTSKCTPTLGIAFVWES